MGNTVELYQLDWSRLENVIGSGDAALVASIDSDYDKRMFTGNDADTERILWRKVVEALIAGPRGAELRLHAGNPGYVEEVSALASFAFLSIIRSQGVLAGTMEHSARGGDSFRDDFLTALPSTLGLTVSGGEIVNRPLCGLLHSEYPSWGGLNKAEIDRVFRHVSIDELPSLDDSDLDGWLYQFVDALETLHEQRSDLVTLYL